MSTLDWNTQQILPGAAESDPVANIQTIPDHNAQRVSAVSGLELATVAFVLYLATTARVPFLSSVREDNPGNFLIMLRMFGYLLSGALVLAFYKSSLRGARQVLPITILVVLCGVSTLWSLQPDTTRFQGLVLLGMTALGVYIGARFSNEEILRLVCITMAVVAVMSVIMMTINLGSIRSILTHTVTGVFVHKNLLGQSMSLGALAWVLFNLSSSRQRFSNLLVLAITLLLLIFSDSMTSVFAFAVVIGILPLLRSAVSGSTRAVVMLVIAIPIAPFITTTIERWTTLLLQEVGRDPTFTGRTGVWEFTLDAISQKPIQGYGFATFWQDPTIISSTENLFYWSPATAHNGYLDIALSIGLFGLVLLIWALLVATRNAFSFAKHQKGIVGLFPLTFLMFFMIYNLSESISGSQPNIVWILFVAISVNMAKWREDKVEDSWSPEVSSTSDDYLLTATHGESR